MAEEKEVVEVPAKFKDIVGAIEKMSVIDLSELVKLLEEKFGVSAVAQAGAGSPGAPSADASAAEEQNAFDVELTAAGDQKVQVIKAIKDALGIGLKEAKDFVDGVPSQLKAGMKKEEAEALKKAIESAGGSVELK